MKHSALRVLRTKGFTLIELLIVIALLGALAVGLLASIDPFEQLKKGTDTSQRNTLAEFYNANLRYYSSKNQWPWGTTVLSQHAIDSNMETYVGLLISAGELKNRFMDLAGRGNLLKMYVTSSGQNVAVCYQPESKGFQLDQNAVYDIDGLTTNYSSCKSQGGTLPCYYCIQ